MVSFYGSSSLEYTQKRRIFTTHNPHFPSPFDLAGPGKCIMVAGRNSPPMKRALFLTVVALAATLTATGPLTTRACQYCRMALEDPESGRMVTDNRGGGFPLDGALNQYQAAPVSPDLKIAPAEASVVTSASALTVPAPAGTTALPAVHRSMPPPAAKATAAKVLAPDRPATVTTATLAPVSTPNALLTHWTDACLLGLAAAGGVFCWRTRRTGA